MKGEKHPWYGKHHTEEAKRKLSESLKGYKHSEDSKRKMSRAHKGKPLSENTKRKISESLKGRKLSDEHRKNLSQAKKNVMTPIVAIQIATGKVKIFESQLECSRVLGINNGGINNCLKGIRKQTGGYTFKKINRDKRVFTVSHRSKADLIRIRGIAI